MAEMGGSVHVQVCYAAPDNVVLQNLIVASGTTLEEAVKQSGILTQRPEIDLATCKLGIYGKLKPLDTVLRERDRIEIYRPLAADPKEARRRRIAKKSQKAPIR